MLEKVAWVDGWEVRPRPDGSFGVYDHHSLLACPFGTAEEAIRAAQKLPHPTGVIGLSKPNIGSPADT
jgi:hypothetical protein